VLNAISILIVTFSLLVGVPDYQQTGGYLTTYALLRIEYGLSASTLALILFSQKIRISKYRPNRASSKKL
jgi:hypothetical protein